MNETVNIETRGLITGPAFAFEILPTSAARVKSWDDTTAIALQDRAREALKSHGFLAESVPGPLVGRKRSYKLYVYRTESERRACFAFHRPIEPDASDEGVGFRLP
jgi:hypothetical protein